MWKVAIVGLEESSVGHLRGCLQQTGLVDSVVEWNPPKWQDPQASGPDVLLLGLARNVESLLAFAADLRKTNPSLRILAYSPESQPDSKLLLTAMRSGVQEILAAPVTAASVQEALLRFRDPQPARG